jgi:hypothetical protein
MFTWAAPQPDEACLWGLVLPDGRAVAVRAWLGEAPAGVKAVHNVTVHSPLAAVVWPLPAELPAGAHDDATAYCR